jgi:hypothetical protein
MPTYLLFVVALVLAAPASAEPKTVRVTGMLAELRDDLIVIEKGKERWEILRTPGTAVKGELRKGGRVSIEVRMSAASVEALGERRKGQ